MKADGNSRPIRRDDWNIRSAARVATASGKSRAAPISRSSGQLKRASASAKRSAEDSALVNSARAWPLLLLYLALVYVRPHEYVPALMGMPIIVSVLVCTFIVWIFQPGKDFSAPHHGLMLGLMVMMSISVAAAGWLGGAFRTVVDFSPVAVLFLVTSTSRLGPEHYRRVFFVIGLSCAVLAIHGIDQVETGVGWSGAKVIEGRITYLGFLGDPNDLALAFLVALPMTLYWARTASSTWQKFGAWLAALLQMIGIYLTNSRGGLVALAAMIAAVAVRRYGYLRSLAVLPFFALAFVLLAPSRVSQISSEEHSAAGRVDSWYEGIQMFIANPLLGVGKGFYTDYHPLTAHNSMVLVFAEMGVLGYFFWFSLLVCTIVMLRRLLKLPLGASQGDAAPGAKPGLKPAPKSEFRLPSGSATKTEAKPASKTSSQTESKILPDDERQQFRDLATTLAFSLSGYLLASMFLSRSYVFLLFFLQALVVSLFLAAHRRWPVEMPLFKARQMFATLVGLELASIVIMYLLTRILL